MAGAGVSRDDRWTELICVIERLSSAHGIQEIVDIVRTAARRLSGADGICVVRRDGDLCHYVDEDAIAPLWKGRRFPMSACISGWCMLNRQTAIIPDIYVDDRIPHDAYRPTFVKSLVMVPVGADAPCAAIGAYWAREHSPDIETVRLLEALARSTAIALANVTLYEALAQSKCELEDRVVARTRALEDANKKLRDEMSAQLTGGIAHDFNNILMVIQTSVAYLKGHRLSPERRTRYLDAIDESAARAARLTNQLLAFARKQPLKPEVFALNDRLREIAEMLRRTMGIRYRIECDLNEDVGFVEADPYQLQTAVLNIALNARDAMPNGGTFLIETRPVAPAPQGDRAAGEFIRVRFIDDGVGMAPDVASRAFEPFFTTKRVGQGTGLGLSQVHGFIAQTGGDVRIDSELGKGTSVTLHLPRAPDRLPTNDAPAKINRAKNSDGDQVCSGEVVLLVEDNPQIGEFTQQILEDMGASVTRVESADAAALVLQSGAKILWFPTS